MLSFVGANTSPIPSNPFHEWVTDAVCEQKYCKILTTYSNGTLDWQQFPCDPTSRFEFKFTIPLEDPVDDFRYTTRWWLMILGIYGFQLLYYIVLYNGMCMVFHPALDAVANHAPNIVPYTRRKAQEAWHWYNTRPICVCSGLFPSKATRPNDEHAKLKEVLTLPIDLIDIIVDYNTCPRHHMLVEPD